MPSVDDVWESMKKEAKPLPKSTTSGKGGGGKANDGNVCNLGKLSQSAGMASDKSSKCVETAELKMSIVDSKHIPGRGFKSHVAMADDDDSSLDREVNLLSSEDTAQRRGALSRLLALANDADCPPAVQRKAFSSLSTEVIKLLSDNVERCRDLALRVLLAFLDVLDPLSLAPALSLLMPSLVYRIGSAPPVESSEEVRLLAILVVSRIVSLFNRKIVEYVEGIDGICRAALQDSHPLVRVEAANVVVMLCRMLKPKMQMVVRMVEKRHGPEPVYRYAEMVKAVKPSLKHKLGKVRVAAIEAVKALLLVGEKNLEVIEDLVSWQAPNIIPVWHFFNGGVWEDGTLVKPDEREVQRNYLAVLAGDKNPIVRGAFVRMIADWMSTLFDRWDHESRLLPYLLNGLCDSVPAIRAEAHGCMERLGAVHEDEKENNDRDKQELRDFREYGHKSPAEMHSAERWSSRPQEPPFTQRPRLGARMVVRNNYKRIVPTLVRELLSWQTDTRRMAGQLLYYITLYCEHWVTAEAHNMLGAYVKAAEHSVRAERQGDPEGTELLKQALRCAEALGMFVDPAVWLPLLLPTVSGSLDTDTDVRCAHIAVLGALCRGSSRSWLCGHAEIIIHALQGPSLLPLSSAPTINVLLAKTASNLTASCAELPPHLHTQVVRLVVGLQCRAWSAGARDLPALAGEDTWESRSSWRGVQCACTDALERACVKGESVGALLAREFDAILAVLVAACQESGGGGLLPLLDVLLRQVDVSLLQDSSVSNTVSLLSDVIRAGGSATGEVLSLCSYLIGSAGAVVTASPSVAGLLETAVECVHVHSSAAQLTDNDINAQGEAVSGGSTVEGTTSGSSEDNVLAALECIYLLLSESAHAQKLSRAGFVQAMCGALCLQHAHVRQLALECVQHAFITPTTSPPQPPSPSSSSSSCNQILAAVVPFLADPHNEVRSAALGALRALLGVSGEKYGAAVLTKAKELLKEMIQEGEEGAADVQALVEAAM